MKPGFLWLFIPLACVAGYFTAPLSPAGHALKAARKEQAALESSKAFQTAKAFENATPAELAAKLKEILGLPPGPARDIQTTLICARWAEVDPTGALAWFAGNKVPTYLRIRLFTEWALLDSDAAWAAIPEGTEGDQERMTVLGALLTEDREVFMKWARRMPDIYPGTTPAWLLVAEQFPDEFATMAARALEKAKDPGTGGKFKHQAQEIYKMLAASRAGKDPAAAVEWANGLDPLVREAVVRSALESWCRSDPAAAWKVISNPDAAGLSLRQGSLYSLAESTLARLAAQDPAGVIKLHMESPGNAQVEYGSNGAISAVLAPKLATGEMSALDAYRLLISAKGWASMIPLNVLPSVWRGMPASALAEGAQAILAEPADRFRGDALGGISSAWFQQDPAAALAFIAAIPDAGLKAEAYSGLFTTRNGMAADPRQQAELLEKIPPADRAAVFAAHLLRYPHPSSDLARQVSSAPKLYPETIAPLLSDLPPSHELNQAVEVNAVTWGESEPSAALAWAATLKDPAARSAATAGALEGWAYHDPYAASEWLGDQPEGPARDAAAVPLVGHLAKSDPDAAWEWAGSIHDADRRLDARATALKAWVARDPEAARTAYREISARLSKTEAAKLSATLTGK